MIHINRTTRQTRDAQAIAGIQKNLTAVPTLTLATIVMTPTELAARFQASIDSANGVDAAYANWRAAVKADRELSKALTPILQGLRQYVLNTFGTGPVLAEFGMKPPKKAVTTAKDRVIAAEKSAATRKARHTMGPVQRKEVKGSVLTTIVTTPTVVTSVPTPPTPDPEGAPAPSAPGGGTPHTG